MAIFPARSQLTLQGKNRDRSFVAVKVCCTRNSYQSARVHQELQFYERVSSLQTTTNHPGQSFIRGLLETFEIVGPTGQHLCLVHTPMHMTIREFQCLNSSRRLNETLLRWTLSNVLQALAFLHEEAEIVHTGQENLVSSSSSFFLADGETQISIHPTS